MLSNEVGLPVLLKMGTHLDPFGSIQPRINIAVPLTFLHLTSVLGLPASSFRYPARHRARSGPVAAILLGMMGQHVLIAAPDPRSARFVSLPFQKSQAFLLRICS